MQPQALEDIAHRNLNIIIDIYKLLPLADQLRLSLTTQWLKNIFETYIWKEHYRTLEISDNCGNFSIANETDANRLYLSPDELIEFLAVYANRVKELFELRDCFPDIGKFRNLTSLKLGRRKNTRQDLQFVAENCFKLESLQVYLWQFPFSNQVLDTKCLLSMKHLKRLELETGGMDIEYKEFRDIVTVLQLECFILEVEIRPENAAYKLPSLKLAKPKCLKELQIIVHDSQFFARHLIIFENLFKLNLQINHGPLDKVIWEIFFKATTQLEVLTIKKTKLLAELDYSLLSPTLKELNIHSCEGLTCENLQQILSLPNLIKFSSLHTRYVNKITFNFRLPPLLQSLNCDHFNTIEFKAAYEGHEHLRELTWYDHNNVTALPVDTGLSSCCALDTLYVDANWISLDAVLQIQNLRKVTIYDGSMNWSYLISLLKHPTLMEFILEVTWADIKFDANVNECIKGFPNNLSIVKISLYVLEKSLDFWLDLFSQNSSRLKMICYDSNVTKETLKDIIENKYFPRDLRSISVWGCTIDCKDLRTNFDKTVEKLQREVVLVDSYKCCLILSKRNNFATN